jgi:2',3'-cyclic-nucleotide 2'-phosphodiesterase (5'-nucleotidase family)
LIISLVMKESFFYLIAGWRPARLVLLGAFPLLLSCQRPWQISPKVQVAALPVEQHIKPDDATEATIAPYREQVQQKMSEVIGRAPVMLQKGPGESALGNFVTDLMLKRARKLSAGPVDLAVVNLGGLRNPLPEGDITIAHVFELMPFENELVVLTLNGSTVQELFTYAASRKDAPMANAAYLIQNGQARNISINGKDFDPFRTYRVATLDYFAGGGDQATFFSQASATEKTGLTLRDAIIQHIRELTAKGQVVTAEIEGRVREM